MSRLLSASLVLLGAVAGLGCGTKEEAATTSLATRAEIAVANHPTIGSARRAGAAPRCRTASLTGHVRSYGGAAGTSLDLLILKNTGTSPCATQGFPGISVLDKNYHQVGRPARRTGEPGHRVLLFPAQSASAVLSAATQLCAEHPPSRAPRHVRVYPPDQHTALVVNATIQPCRLFTTPLQKGTASPATRKPG